MGHLPIQNLTSQFQSLGQEHVGENEKDDHRIVSSCLKLNHSKNDVKDVQHMVHLKSAPKENKWSYVNVVQRVTR
jgi:hypothetical protein